MILFVCASAANRMISQAGIDSCEKLPYTYYGHFNLKDIVMPNDTHPTVWSSEQGDRRKTSQSQSVGKSLPPPQQIIYLHRESKGRGGKTVTLVKGLVLSEEDLKSLTKQLKQICGTGGTFKDGLIEIQGEHRERIAEALKKLGYKVKIAGG